MLRRIRLSPRLYQNRSKYKAALAVILFLLVIILIFNYLQNRLTPVVEQVARSRASYLAGRVINSAVNEQIENSNIQYDDLVQLEKDNDGRISALKTNMIQINKFKAEITNTVLEKIHQLDTSEISIPLGSILDSEVFAGRGPRIPIIIVPVGSAEADFASVFKAAGINQTRHQIIVTVTVDISVILPGFSVSMQLTSDVSIAETVIVGNVPNSYTYLEDNGQSGSGIYRSIDIEGE
ncbi:MAG: sporulation protein YunB [Oscillospiraceae bacterium]|jgi:sporulation protein YunB|nr:sporulation protein YunB [Oscillospiraceae bacterium]